MEIPWNKIQKTSTCWNWTGYICPAGYGDSFDRKGKRTRAHRLVYEALVRKIPEGLVIDHLCRNKKCVNPEHLEAVTQGENVRRAIRSKLNHCIRGHEFEGRNLIIFKMKGGGTYRACRTCNYMRKSNARQLKREKRANGVL